MTTMDQIKIRNYITLYHTYFLLYSNRNRKMTSYYVTINLETKDNKVNKITTWYYIMLKIYTKILGYLFAMLYYIKSIMRFGLLLTH